MATKYPILIVSTILLTAFILTTILLNITATALSKEIDKRGVAIAEGFASANVVGLINKNHATLQFNINTLAQNNDVVDAFLINHKNTIIAARNPADIGKIYISRAGLSNPDKYKHLSQSPFVFQAPLSYDTLRVGTFIVELSQKPLHVAITNARMRVGIFALVIAIALSLILFIVVRRTLQPIQWMNAALAKIAQGNFSQRIHLKRNDELGDLAQAFNDMTSRAELFFHYVDRSIVERLIADPSLAKPGGNLRELAVLFGDMRGYTSMSNRRTADEVVYIINTYFHLFIEIVALFDGVVDKTMGDAIMAIFERVENDPEQYKRRGVLAAGYMKAANTILNTFLQKRIQQGETFIQEPRDFGFAIAAGKAIVGNIGNARRMDYSVCGRIVNLAARLESETQQGEVIIDNFSQMGTRDLISSEKLPPVQPKGFSKEEMVSPHRVTSFQSIQADQLREDLEKLFSKTFVYNQLLPTTIEDEQIAQWSKNAWYDIQNIIYSIEIENLFSLKELNSWA